MCEKNQWCGNLNWNYDSIQKAYRKRGVLEGVYQRAHTIAHQRVNTISKKEKDPRWVR